MAKRNFFLSGFSRPMIVRLVSTTLTTNCSLETREDDLWGTLWPHHLSKGLSMSISCGFNDTETYKFLS